MAVAHINSDFNHSSSSSPVLFGAEVQLGPLLLKVEREVSQILHTQGKLIEHSTAMIGRTLEYLERCLPKVSEAMAEINSANGRTGRITSNRTHRGEEEFIFSDVDEGVKHDSSRSTEDRLREMEGQIASLLAHFDSKSPAQTKSGDIANVMNNRDITLSSGLLKHLQNSPQNFNHNMHNKSERVTTLQQAIERLADELAYLRASTPMNGLREQEPIEPIEDLKIAAWLRDHTPPKTLATQQPPSSSNALSVEGFLTSLGAGNAHNQSVKAHNACTAEDLRIGFQSLEEKVLTHLASWPRWFDAELKRHRDELLEAMKKILTAQLASMEASPSPEGVLASMKNSSNSQPAAIDAAPDPRKILRALANSRPPPIEVAAGPERNVKTQPAMSPLQLAGVSGSGFDTPLSTPGSERVKLTHVDITPR